MSGPGVCPCCGAEGESGAPCSERVCGTRGYHLVPRAGVPADGQRLAPEIGLVIDGRYLVTRLLGEGGFGRVFVALQRPLGMQVALKLLKRDHEADAHAARMRLFHGEARAMAQLSHPNIVQLKDFGLFEGAAYLVIEFVEGGRTLKDELRTRARERRELELDEVEAILGGILSALEEAHAKGIIHRDIKPENVMLQAKAGHPILPRLLDFGLAKFVDAETQSSAVMGTPMYMAPEQLTKTDPGPWTDLYALGVLAYELMTGRRPFAGEVGQVIADKRNPRFDVLAAIADLAVPDPIARFLAKALAFDVALRFRSAAEMRGALRAALAAAASAGRPELRSIDVSRLVEAPWRATEAPPIAAILAATPPARVLRSETQSAPHAPDHVVGPPRRRRWVLAALGAATVVATTAALVVASGRAPGDPAATHAPAPTASSAPTGAGAVDAAGPADATTGASPDVAAPVAPIHFAGTYATTRAELAFASAGTVASVAVHEGDWVKRGDTLASLDTRGAASDLAEAETQLRVNQDEVTRTRADYDAVQRSFAEHTATEAALDEAKTSWAFAVGFVEKANKRIANAKAQLAAATLRAARAGRVVAVRVMPGEVVTAGAGALVVESSDGASIELQVPPERAARIAIGDRATVVLANAATVADAIAMAQVSRIDPLATGGARVTLALPAERVQADPPAPWTADVTLAP